MTAKPTPPSPPCPRSSNSQGEGVIRHRSTALDALRGLAVAGMVVVNNPGSWQHLYPPLAHAPWHGVTPTDLVFPFFLFAVGAAMAFALPAPDTQARAFWPPVLRRAALIFGLGVFLNISPFVRWSAEGELVARSWEQLRILGVLQRIALCYLGAAAIVRFVGAARAAHAAALLLLAYWLACVALSTDPYSLQGWFGTAIDRALLGENHLYKGEGVPFDPEGLASTPPAIAQTLIGLAAGRLLVGRSIDAAVVMRCFLWATLLLALGYAASLVMPLNKKIWTSSYVLHTSGLALLSLAVLAWWLDLRQRSDAFSATAGDVLVAFGRNALLVFFLAGFLPRLLALFRWKSGEAWTSPLPALYQNVFAAIPGDPRLGSLAYALFVFAAFTALTSWLHRRRWYWSV
jgi:predicted acyltransferase